MEYITGQSLNFEDVLIPQAGTLGGVPMARMSPSTGAVFLLAGAAMALMLLAAILDKPYRIWANWAGGVISKDHAQRLWDAFPLVAETLVEFGPDLIETVIPAVPLARRATAYITGGMTDRLDWLVRLREIVALKTETLHDPSLGQTALFEQYTRMLIALDRKHPLLLVLDDLQWADIGSISLLFHLGRRLEGRRILIVGAYRPEELALGRGEERRPLDSVINEFRLTYGDITIDLDRAEKRHFVDAYLDSEPNRLGTQFRETLYHQTKGHPLFLVEFLRGMQERGDLVQDQDGCWIEGHTLDWEILPTRIEAVIAERVGRLDARSQEAFRSQGGGSLSGADPLAVNKVGIHFPSHPTATG